MLIEAAKGGHTNVVTMLIDYPNSLVMAAAAASGGPPGGPNPDAAAQAAAGMWTLIIISLSEQSSLLRVNPCYFQL